MTRSPAKEIDRLLDELEQDQLGRHYAYPGSKPGQEGPYPWQHSFHDAGIKFAERAIIAASRSGKTRTAAAEVAIHASGLYPKWWGGRRFDRPIAIIVVGQTNEDVRDIQQLALMGPINERKRPSGRGWVPGALIGDCSYRQCGVDNVIDTVLVRSAFGGNSAITFKSYQQGWEKFQGRSTNLIWLDEEVDDYRIFSECETRLVSSNGCLIFTATPLKGMSDTVRHFLDRNVPGTWYVTATWEDAPHLSLQQRTEWAARYPQHERDTRTKGIPLMGTGLVYPVPDEMVRCAPFPIPQHYRRICGVDFGIDHPAAAAWLAHDADCDILYLYDAYRQSGETPAYHAQAIISRGKWIPVAWPHDGMQRDKGSGKPLANQYRERGVNMLAEPAQWDAEAQVSRGVRAQSREAGAIELLERMQTGRFKVFDSPGPSLFLEEKRMLHRKDGQIVPVRDDIESATRYALMMLRCATTDQPASRRPTSRDDAGYDPLEDFSRPQPVRSYLG